MEIWFFYCYENKRFYKAINYITKYVTKDICADLKGKHRYIASKNLHEPTELKLLLYPDDCNWYAQLMYDTESWLRYMVQKIAENHGYNFKYESVVDGFKELFIRYINSILMKER